jgi:hypothetical protein
MNGKPGLSAKDCGLMEVLISSWVSTNARGNEPMALACGAILPSGIEAVPNKSNAHSPIARILTATLSFKFLILN